MSEQFVIDQLLERHGVAIPLAPAPPKKRLRCSECGAAIHRHERYTITGVRHRDCVDTKLAGQMGLPVIGLPESEVE